jgi:serine/threonine protein kinase
MSKHRQVWEEDGWVRGGLLGEGLQGRTYFARRIDDEPSTFDFVLKELKRQKDGIRRRRFFLETQHLRALDFEGVAKLVHTNAEKFSDANVELYAITDFIRGPDLSNLRTLPTDLSSACRITIALLSIIGRCHEIGVVHRDIKPCHVIFRNGEDDKPVMIDFGLAANLEPPTDQEITETAQGVGNRFIILPEQLDGSDKHNTRSDITQCVGLFYYLLTSRRPGLIVDPSGRKPHERFAVVPHSTWSSRQRDRLTRILDVAFEWDAQRRWPDSRSLIEQLNCLMNDKDNFLEPSFVAGLDTLLQRIQRDPEQELRLKTKKLCDLANERSNLRSQESTQKFKDHLSFGGGVYQSQSGVNLVRTWHLTPTLGGIGGSTAFQLALHACRDQDNFVMKAEVSEASGGFFQVSAGVSSGHPTLFELTRSTPILSPNSFDFVTAFVDEVWVKSIEKIFYPV